jgi:Do/DeqQ family serine protease
MVFRKALAVTLAALTAFMAGLLLTGRVRLDWTPIAGSTTAAAAPVPALETDARPALRTAAPAAPSAAAPEAPAQAPAVAAGAPDFTSIAEKAVKSVVNISSLQVVRTPNSPFANDPFFRYFFGDDAMGMRDRRSLSLGSGVVISPDGYIVTNNHVVGENEQRITIALGGDREVEGTLVGTDPATDIALIKIDDTSGLTVMPWGDSNALKIGEWVLAIGSPFQLSQTVTAGIVSAVGRSNVGFAQYEDFIQTDAAINPGNSGGALVNPRGELVGINTGIFSESGGYQGIGFAVPSNLAKRIVADLKQYGEVRRGTIDGIVSIDRLTQQWASELGAPNTNGALIERMAPNSAAYRAGLRPGDVIVGYNGTAVSDPSQFYRLMADSPIGSTATLRVLTDGRERDVTVKIVSSSSSSGGRRTRGR